MIKDVSGHRPARMGVRACFATALSAALLCSVSVPAGAVDLPSPAIGDSPSIGVDASQITGLLEEHPAFHQSPGAIRNEFGGNGSHEVVALQEAYTCTGIVYRVYNRILQRGQGFEEPAQCYGAFPESLQEPVTGVQFVYPADLDQMESARLIVLSPGIGVEPGMLDRQARVYASHGYIVAMGYNLHNWTGSQVALATAAVLGADKTPGSPLYGKVDASRTLLVGHSAGGGSVVTVNNSMDSVLQGMGFDFSTVGIVAVNQGPGDFGKLSKPVSVPGLWIRAENENIVPLPQDRLGYERTVAPAWFTVMKDAYHGTFMDMPEKSAYSAIVMAFAEYLLDGTDRAKNVFEGANYSLNTDSEFKDSERKNM